MIDRLMMAMISDMKINISIDTLGYMGSNVNICGTSRILLLEASRDNRPNFDEQDNIIRLTHGAMTSRYRSSWQDDDVTWSAVTKIPLD